MSEATLYGIGIAVLFIVIIGISAIRIVKEYERGVIFRLGRVIGAKGPGLFFIIPVIDRMVKVNLQTFTNDIPSQDIITRDNVTVRVNAVAYFNVVDSIRATVAIQDYLFGTSQVAQTTLRSVIGQADLDELLVSRDEINRRLQKIIDDLTNPWGVKVTLVEVKDVELPEAMRRAMARQAVAERDRRAKVIHAKGELEAAETLSQAGRQLREEPAAMELRVLSTMSEIASDRTTTVIFPLPLDTLKQLGAALRGGNGQPGGTEQRGAAANE
jgi:regulator of protease activity HflC (stomatin/prohibitin superfamily)